MKAIKTKLSVGSLARAALVAGVLLTAHVASAATVTANVGDVYIGFRKAGALNNLLVDLGSATNFTASSLGAGYGGTLANGASFTAINLAADLTAVFGSGWANNPGDGTGVTWAVVGVTDANNDNQAPFTNLTANSIYVTKARTNPGVQSSTFVLGNLNNASSGIQNVAANYDGLTSTVNSNFAVIQATSDPGSWSALVGNQNSAFGTGKTLEQASSGAYSGPTDSVLDLYLGPNAGSTGGTTSLYLGNFSVASNGNVNFSAVPEPSTYALLALTGTIFMVFIRRRNRLNNSIN